MAEFVTSSCLRDFGHNAYFGAIPVMQCCWKEEEVFAVFRKENCRSVRKKKRRTYYFDNALSSGFELE
jgi:hypothetical protein